METTEVKKHNHISKHGTKVDGGATKKHAAGKKNPYWIFKCATKMRRDAKRENACK